MSRDLLPLSSVVALRMHQILRLMILSISSKIVRTFNDPASPIISRISILRGISGPSAIHTEQINEKAYRPRLRSGVVDGAIGRRERIKCTGKS